GEGELEPAGEQEQGGQQALNHPQHRAALLGRDRHRAFSLRSSVEPAFPVSLLKRRAAPLKIDNRNRQARPIPRAQRGLPVLTPPSPTAGLPDLGEPWVVRIKRLLLGGKRELDPTVFHKVSLIALLAWVGLGADGLSSSAYGPEEAFKTLGAHTYLALALAVATAFT